VKLHLSFLIVFILTTACGANITVGKAASPSVPVTPVQKMAASENSLSAVGITFDSTSNTISTSSCSSVHEALCVQRIADLNDYINRVFDLYVSENLMPLKYQQRVQSAVACVNQINSDLQSATASNCHH